MFGVIDEVAYQGPFILTLLVAIGLLNQWPFFLGFGAGFWLNNRLNEILKGIIREPRPSPIDLKAAQMRDPLLFFRKLWSEKDGMYLSRAHIWGMPSGHAQMASFALVFYYLVREKYIRLNVRFDRETLIFGGMFLLFMMTLYQRWETKAHTIAQLLVGTIVGSLFAGSIFFCVKWWLLQLRSEACFLPQ